MTLLADAMSPELRRQFIGNALKPGTVIHIPVSFSTITKDKFLVLVGVCDPDCLTFVVNSETNHYIASRPELYKCQVTIDAANHAFLDYDSQISCHEIVTLKRSDVINEIAKDVNKGLKGKISSGVQDEILSAVKAAATLSARQKQTVIDAFS